MIADDPHNRRGKSRLLEAFLEALIDVNIVVHITGGTNIEFVDKTGTLTSIITQQEYMPTLKNADFYRPVSGDAANPIKRVTVGKSKGDKANKKLLRAKRGW